MSDENKNINQTDADKAKIADQIKKLESDIKLAFKEEHFGDARKIADEIKKIYPKNHLANRLIEKMDKADEKAKKELNATRIKAMVDQIKDLLKNEKWDDVIKKSNELLSLEWNHDFALKAIKKAATAKKVEFKTLITILVPEGKSIAEDKPGIFAKLFGKKDKKEINQPIKQKIGFFNKLFQKDTEELPDITESANIIAIPDVSLHKNTENTVSMVKEAHPTTPLVTGIQPDNKITDIKPVISNTAPNMDNKSGFFAKLFKKSVVSIPTTAVGQKSEISHEVVPSGQSAKGNVFTRLFGKKVSSESGLPTKENRAVKSDQSIIETIVSQTDKPSKNDLNKKNIKEKDSTGENFLKFANLFLRFTVIFVIISAGFFYIFNIDENNQVLQVIGKDNYASQLKKAASTLEGKKNEEKNMSKEINLYQKGYIDKYEQMVDKIIKNRMDWNDLIRKLNEVTESVYDKNTLAQYVQYNNYSYDVSDGKLTVNATLTDPLGKNLTKLAELEEAFQYYPKNKNDSSDKRTPYFYNMQEFKSYAKTLDKTTDRYTSNFSILLYTKELAKKQ